MAKIEGHIATRNNTHTIKVCIYNKNCNKPSIHIDASRSVKFADNPVTITQQQDDTFEHILKTQCKIRLVSKQWLGDYLFASNYFSIVVNVWVDDDCVFCGVVKPLSYNQNFAHTWEEIEIVATDLLSTLKDRRLTDIASWDELNAQSQIRPFSWFLGNMDLDTKTVVIPNFPDIDYGEAEMMWTEIDWERIVNPDGSITYYGIEAEIVVLDEETAMNTGELRQGEEKEVTWIESDTDTCIVDGVSYYKSYAHITVCGEDVNTGDWRIGSMVEGGMPEVVSTVSRLDGWTRGALPQPFEYYEHFTTYNVYDNEMEMVASDYIGDQIPLSPSTTTNGSYYEFRQGSDTDLDVDETTGYLYYKNYSWCVVNGVAQNTGDWVRGERYIAEEYVEYNSTDKSLTFYFDNKRSTREGTIYNLNSGNNYPDWYTDLIDNHIVPVTSVVFDNSFVIARPTTTSKWFLNMQNLTSITGIRNLNTSSVTDMSMMFQSCRKLTSIDVAGFDTSNVTTMNQMFDDCVKLVYLDVRNFNTSNVTNMAHMFSGCEDLTNLDVTGFDTSNVTEIGGMFNGCYDLTNLDVTGFDTSNVTDMGDLFRYCSSLTSIDVSTLDTSNVIYMTAMFQASGYTTLDLSTFNTSNVTVMGGMFSHCHDITSINISNFDMTKVVPNSQGTHTHEMFWCCDSLTTLIIDNVSNDTFNKIIDPYADLPRNSTMTIYRDGTIYKWNSSTSQWEAQS